AEGAELLAQALLVEQGERGVELAVDRIDDLSGGETRGAVDADLTQGEQGRIDRRDAHADKGGEDAESREPGDPAAARAARETAQLALLGAPAGTFGRLQLGRGEAIGGGPLRTGPLRALRFRGRRGFRRLRGTRCPLGGHALRRAVGSGFRFGRRRIEALRPLHARRPVTSSPPRAPRAPAG